MTRKYDIPSSVKPLHDKALFVWIESGIRLSPRGRTYLSSFMPDCFEAYVRILHPAYELGADIPVSWGEIAGQRGTTLHAAACFEALAGGTNRQWQDPTLGQMPEATGKELAGILGKFTQSKIHYFGIWEGYPRMRPILEQAVCVSLPGRVYGLFSGSLDTVLALIEERKLLNGPNLWWPADKAWLCVSDIDEVSTYVGGSQACISEILASGLEAFEVEIDARIDPASDTVNQGGDTINN